MSKSHKALPNEENRPIGQSDRTSIAKALTRLEAAIGHLEKAMAHRSSPRRTISRRPPSGINVGIIGLGSHGKKHLEGFLKESGCHISHVCDVDRQRAQQAADRVQAVKGYRPKVALDLREVLASPEVTAVSLVTPHHWHAVAATWALQAKKHVYIEKPVTHTFAEGAPLLAAASKYGKVVQSGTQLRSNTSLAAAGEYIRSGQLGHVEVVHCIVYKHRPQLPMTGPAPVPSTVDLDLWCGPAFHCPPARSKFHYHWHWFWDYGNGALGNNGIHRIDAARIALGLKGYGDLVLSYGGRFGPKDMGETPNTQFSLHKFGSTWVVQDVMGLKAPPFEGITNGVVFHGTKGKIVYKSGQATLFGEDGKEIRRFDGKQESHFKNFLDAVRANDPTRVTGQLAEGIVSSELCHLGNISYRLGMEASDTQILAKIEEVGAPQLVHDLFHTMRGTLTRHGVTDSLVLGEVLHLQDSRQQPILNSPRAAALLEGKHRSPFTLRRAEEPHAPLHPTRDAEFLV